MLPVFIRDLVNTIWGMNGYLKPFNIFTMKMAPRKVFNITS